MFALIQAAVGWWRFAAEEPMAEEMLG